MSKNPIDFRCQPRVIPKGWGREIIIASQPCLSEHGESSCGMSGKILEYDKAGGKSSMHFHIQKSEYFYVLQGSFILRTIHPGTAIEYSDKIATGEIIYLSRGTCHQIEALEDLSKIIEIATHDNAWDSVRIRPGDSQDANHNAQKSKHS